MHGIFVLSFRRIDRAFESCGSSFSVIVVATRDRYNDQKKKKNDFTGKRYRVSRSIVRSKETKVKICEDEPLNEIADTSRKVEVRQQRRYLQNSPKNFLTSVFS